MTLLVVLPTPPFWLMTAIDRMMAMLLSYKWLVSCVWMDPIQI
ncbi:hypothetical protein RBSWK_02445 [Rhodopirellula baltica SWK14]|uniref:Uncharacterized protein n=1 Tax=Rhodopirellula baltica SWK14 TaxID=993516 RepID=L7CHS6_RHOBT|nr:hypothetical protein RBSWK_02445 [Rhodopirellula baltica SWK14]